MPLTAAQSSARSGLQHRRISGLLAERRWTTEGDRRLPITLVLAPEPGITPSTQPPVRIFVGTEPAAFRAERVLVWSIRKHRDPRRTYEIHLLSQLREFDYGAGERRFCRYRYAVPGFAGYSGRAIYNDVDQIYCADPALLFDQDLNGAAVLGTEDPDSPVLLLDCAQLQNVWPLETARKRQRAGYFRRAAEAAGLWGTLDRSWYAADEAFRPGTSRLLHFRREHTRPWQPAPDRFRYAEHSFGDLWHALEREADAQQFTLFSATVPSARYGELLDLYGQMHESGRPDTGRSAGSTFSGVSLTEHVAPVAHLVRTHGARTILDYGAGKGTLYQPAPGRDPASRFKVMAQWGEAEVTCYDPAYAPFAEPYADRYDGVISTDVLEHIPAEDIPWVLHHLFAHASRFVYLVAACFPAKKILPDGTNAHCTLCPPYWWVEQVRLVARAYPAVAWTLCAQEKSPFAFEQRRKLFKKGIRSHFFTSGTN
jgi:hypothetical protein